MDQIQIFISYAREDQAKARDIYRRLREAGHSKLLRAHAWRILTPKRPLP
jgi:hypothetical protein